MYDKYENNVQGKYKNFIENQTISWKIKKKRWSTIYLMKGNEFMFYLKCCRARGIYYLSTNGHKPYARGLPVKSQRTTNRKRSSSRQY